jgi:hypothetical protein
MKARFVFSKILSSTYSPESIISQPQCPRYTALRYHTMSGRNSPRSLMPRSIAMGKGPVNIVERANLIQGAKKVEDSTVLPPFRFAAEATDYRRDQYSRYAPAQSAWSPLAPSPPSVTTNFNSLFPLTFTLTFLIAEERVTIPLS